VATFSQDPLVGGGRVVRPTVWQSRCLVPRIGAKSPCCPFRIVTTSAGCLAVAASLMALAFKHPDRDHGAGIRARATADAALQAGV
jgi:hypothetical protein